MTKSPKQHKRSLEIASSVSPYKTGPKQPTSNTTPASAASPTAASAVITAVTTSRERRIVSPASGKEEYRPYPPADLPGRYPYEFASHPPASYGYPPVPTAAVSLSQHPSYVPPYPYSHYGYDYWVHHPQQHQYQYYPGLYQYQHHPPITAAMQDAYAYSRGKNHQPPAFDIDTVSATRSNNNNNNNSHQDITEEPTQATAAVTTKTATTATKVSHPMETDKLSIHGSTTSDPAVTGNHKTTCPGNLPIDIPVTPDKKSLPLPLSSPPQTTSGTLSSTTDGANVATLNETSAVEKDMAMKRPTSNTHRKRKKTDNLQETDIPPALLPCTQGSPATALEMETMNASETVNINAIVKGKKKRKKKQTAAKKSHTKTKAAKTSNGGMKSSNRRRQSPTSTLPKTRKVTGEERHKGSRHFYYRVLTLEQQRHIQQILYPWKLPNVAQPTAHPITTTTPPTPSRSWRSMVTASQPSAL